MMPRGIRIWLTAGALILALAAPLSARADEQTAARAAKARWLRAEGQSNSTRYQIERRILNSCEFIAATDAAARARLRLETLRQSATQAVTVSPAWQDLLAQRTELDKQLAELHRTGADMDRILQLATQLSQVRRQMADLKQAALHRVQGLDEARDELLRVHQQLRQMQDSVQQSVLASEQWQQARAHADASREQYRAAAVAAERAAAARWAAEQARLAALIMP